MNKDITPATVGILEGQKRYPPHAQFSWHNALSGLIFCILFFSVLLVLDHTFYNTKVVCSTWDRIQDGNGPQILILGNSHAFTAFVPDIIEGATGATCGVLGSAAESIMLTAENLRVTLRYYTPDSIILESSCISNKVNTKTDKAYILHDIDGMRTPADKVSAALSVLDFEDIPLALSQLFRSTDTWSRWAFLLSPQIKSKGHTMNLNSGFDIKGFRSQNSYAKGISSLDTVDASYTAEAHALDSNPLLITENEQALLTFLNMAQEKSIPVFIIRSPIAFYDAREVQAQKQIEKIAESYDCVRLVRDLNQEQTEIGLMPEDFYDKTHLNRRGAVKLTEYYINQYLSPALNVTPNYKNVFFYRTESIEELGGDTYRYTVEAFGEGVQYRFLKDLSTGSLLEKLDNEKYELLQDWSTVNYVDSSITAANASKIRAIMLPAGISTDEAATYGLTLNFMPPNRSIRNTAQTKADKETKADVLSDSPKD